MVYFICSLISSTLIFSLWLANRKRQFAKKELRNCCKAVQLQRAASHMYSLARAGKEYALHNALVLVIVLEVLRLLKQAEELDPSEPSTAQMIAEVTAFLKSVENDTSDGMHPTFSSSSLPMIDAKMQLSEILRLLNNMKKQNLILHELYRAIVETLQYAQQDLEKKLNSQLRLEQARAHREADVDREILRSYSQPAFS